MKEFIRTENGSYWNLAGYLSQMVVRFDNLTTFLLGKGILNEADLDDIKNTEKEIGQLAKDVAVEILLHQADEGKPQ